MNTKVADEAWIAAATLQRERPSQDFSVKQIRDRATQLGFTRSGVGQHISQHAVANVPRSSGDYRLLFATARGRRRLFRRGDAFDPARSNGKLLPRLRDLPPRWRPLLAWYEQWQAETRTARDPLLALWRSGRDLWANEPADVYIRRLREGWS